MLLELILVHPEHDTALLSNTIKVSGTVSTIPLPTLANLFTEHMAAEIHTKEPGGQDAGKTHTVLLLDRNEQCLLFGSKALDAYYNENHNATNLLFKKFKMNLDTSNGNIKTKASCFERWASNR